MSPDSRLLRSSGPPQSVPWPVYLSVIVDLNRDDHDELTCTVDIYRCIECRGWDGRGRTEAERHSAGHNAEETAA